MREISHVLMGLRSIGKVVMSLATCRGGQQLREDG